MSRFRFPFDPTAPADRDDVRLAAELQAIAQDDTRRPRPQQISRRTRRGHALRHALRPKTLPRH
ncbi:hypothetical protein [Janibacter indicus]|uniref:hypothetical protein n=1 Tax=Janibacter indicus TaxID=857417 RepID=UPI003EB9AC60